VQVFVTIGGGTRLIPLTGVTLPLISMGGSSLSTTILMFSLIQGIYVKEFDYKNLSKEKVQDLEDKEDEDVLSDYLSEEYYEENDSEEENTEEESKEPEPLSEKDAEELAAYQQMIEDFNFEDI